MAEVLLKQQQPQLNVFSSGIGNHPGRPADPFAIELMSEKKNLDLSNHCSQHINPTLVTASDLILTMEKKHIDIIHSKYPESRGKVYLIGKWLDNQEVPDPYRKEKKAFISAFDLIEAGLEAWQKKIWDNNLIKI